MSYAVWHGLAADESSGDLVVLASPTVIVTDKRTGANAPLFSTRTGTGKSNPFTGGADGSITFYVKPGRYKIVADDGSGNTATWDDQLIGEPHEEDFIKTVDSLSDMQALGAGDYSTVYMRGRTTVGDGGEGNFRWDSSDLSTEVGNDPGKVLYVAPDSTPSGANGAWVRQLVAPEITLKMAGVVFDDSTDNATAIGNLNTLMAASNTAPYASGSPPIKNLGGQQWRVVVNPGIAKTSVPLIAYNGTNIHFESGAVLKASTAGQDSVLRSDGPAERASGVYSANGTTLTGYGIIDCDGKAARGLVWDTMAEQSGITGQITVIKATNSKYTTTGSGSSGTHTLTLGSTTDVSVYDTITIGGENLGSGEPKYYTIEAISGSDITLSDNLDTSPSGATVTHVPVGLTCVMVQQQTLNVLTMGNSIGAILSTNLDGVQCTDIEIGQGGSDGDEKAGWVFARASGIRLRSVRLQKTTDGRNWVLQRGRSITAVKPYIEPAADSDTSRNLKDVPLIENEIGGVTLIDVNWPTNSGQTTFRRLIRNKGGSATITRIIAPTASLNENPDRAGDVAPVDQDGSVGQIAVLDVVGPTNINEPQDIVIDDDSGTVMPTAHAFAQFWNNGATRYQGNPIRSYQDANALTHYEQYTNGENEPRLVLLGNRLQIGDGSSSPDSSLERPGANTLGMGTGDSFIIQDATNGGGVGSQVVSTLQFEAADGTVYHLWVDSTGVLRIANTKPADESSGGTVVGTQS